jgi:hypothetical protein
MTALRALQAEQHLSVARLGSGSPSRAGGFSARISKPDCSCNITPVNSDHLYRVTEESFG